jgi:predicted phage replisome organizer
MAEGMKWIKLATNIFDQGKIKLIMRMPAGDTIIAIWLQILTHCGKECQDGILRISNEVPYTADMLAMIFGREPSTMRLALETFQQLKMIEVIDGVYCLPNWNKYQSPDKYEINRAKDRKRLQEWRKKQKEKSEFPQIATSSENETFHETFPKRNETGTEIEVEVDKELEEELDIEGTTKNKNNCLSAAAAAFNNNFSKTEVITRDHSKQSPVGVKTVDFYNKNVFPLSSSYERERLLDLADEYGDEWCIAACKEAIDHQARSIAYIDKVLRTWRAKGYRKISDKKSAPVLDEQYNDIPF